MKRSFKINSAHTLITPKSMIKRQSQDFLTNAFYQLGLNLLIQGFLVPASIKRTAFDYS